MSRQPLLKVYGHIYPADDALYAALANACADALPDNDDIPVLERDGDMNFRGAYLHKQGRLSITAVQNYHNALT